MTEADAIGYVLLGVFILGSFVALLIQQKKLDDPNNDEVVYLDQLLALSKLSGKGFFILRTLRQSGNLQKEDREFTDFREAIAAGISTFKRAKIEYVMISKNDGNSFVVRRPYWNHRGRSEGKKVGSFEVYRVDQS